MTVSVESLGGFGRASVRGAINELLEAQRALSAKFEDASPLITVHLAGGTSLRGLLLGSASDAKGEALLLEICERSDARGSGDLAYVDPAAVIALSVHSISPLVRELARLKPLSAIELRRRLQDAGKALSARLGTGLEVTAEGFDPTPTGDQAFVFARLIDLVCGAIAHVAATPLGQEALRSKTKVSLRKGPAADVKASGQTLAFTAKLTTEAEIEGFAWIKALEDAL